MTVPFGISIGDFIAIINTIHTSIISLQDSRGSHIEYQGLLGEIESLQTVICEIKNRDIGEDCTLEKVLQQAIDTIGEFGLKIEKYRLYLREGGSGRTWKDCLRKIQWGLYTQDGIQKFQSRIQAHTAVIQILLQKATIASIKKKEQRTEAVIARLGCRMDVCVRIIYGLVRVLAEYHDNLQGLISTVCLANIHGFFWLLAYFQQQISISRSIQFEQPAVLEDAHGRIFPIHLQWTDCWEAFDAVLTIQFKSVPGLKKIEND